MINYRIGIIDEDPDDVNRFQLYVHRNDNERRFTVVPIYPQPNFDETLEAVLSENLDAVISDYRLNEYKANITYDGIKLVNAVLERKASFPCFVLTSFDDDAVKDSEDVNIVYIKGIMKGESNAKITFLQRIENQIQKYRTRLTDANARLNELILLKQSHTLNPKEEDEYVNLSHLLDKAIVGKESIPRAFYSKDTNTKLDEIIAKTADLINIIKSGDDNPA